MWGANKLTRARGSPTREVKGIRSHGIWSLPRLWFHFGPPPKRGTCVALGGNTRRGKLTSTVPQWMLVFLSQTASCLVLQKDKPGGSFWICLWSQPQGAGRTCHSKHIDSPKTVPKALWRASKEWEGGFRVPFPAVLFTATLPYSLQHLGTSKPSDNFHEPICVVGQDGPVACFHPHASGLGQNASFAGLGFHSLAMNHGFDPWPY